MTTMQALIRALIIDDHPLYRDGVASALERDATFQVVGQCATSDEAEHLARECQPDIALLDVGILGGGIEAIGRVRGVSPATRVIMLTVDADPMHVQAAFKAGAAAYVLKEIGARELAGIVRVVQNGEGYITPSLGATIVTSLSQHDTPNHDASPRDALSERERRVLDLIATGQSNKEIGKHLNLSEKTIKHYVTGVLQKLGVRNRVEAAAYGRNSAESGAGRPKDGGAT